MMDRILNTFVSILQLTTTLCVFVVMVVLGYNHYMDFQTTKFINSIQTHYCIYGHSNAVNGIVNKRFNRQWLLDNAIRVDQPWFIDDWYINDRGEIVVYIPSIMERVYSKLRTCDTIQQLKNWNH